MSESAVKEQRRELRRAMGAEAVKVVEQQSEVLARLQKRLLWLDDALELKYNIRTDVYEIGVVKRLERMHGEALVGLETAVQALEAFQDRTLWGRLVWLVTGR